jgi:molybdate transport system ATP-binding protein
MDLLEIDIALPRRAFELCASLSVGPETLALIGPSGSGKSSLLRTVAGLERPRSGRIALGREIWCDTRAGKFVTAERRRVGYLPQDYGLFPHMSVAANVRFAAGRERPDLLARVGVSHLAHARPRDLSGGERQRAALARALAREPRVLLLDEPFGALDAITRHQVREELAELLATLPLPTLLVTHSFDDGVALAHRVGVIDHGRLVQLGTPHELLRSPETAAVARLTGANVVEGTATPSGAGATVLLSGGGVLETSTPATGSVDVVVQPWELELTDAASAPLVDTVVNVREDRGRLLIRLTRFTVQAEPSRNGRPSVAEGQAVGLRAAPGDVRVIAPNETQPAGATSR